MFRSLSQIGPFVLVVAKGMADAQDTRMPKKIQGEVRGPFGSMHALFAAADRALAAIKV